MNTLGQTIQQRMNESIEIDNRVKKIIDEVNNVDESLKQWEQNIAALSSKIDVIKGSIQQVEQDSLTVAEKIKLNAQTIQKGEDNIR